MVMEVRIVVSPICPTSAALPSALCDAIAIREMIAGDAKKKNRRKWKDISGFGSGIVFVDTPESFPWESNRSHPRTDAAKIVQSSAQSSTIWSERPGKPITQNALFANLSHLLPAIVHPIVTHSVKQSCELLEHRHKHTQTHIHTNRKRSIRPIEKVLIELQFPLPWSIPTG